jgi:hypothetical protein
MDHEKERGSALFRLAEPRFYRMRVDLILDPESIQVI